jgi:hypothetical protein
MECRNARNLFDEMLMRPDGPDAAVVRAHMASCASCQRAFSQWRDVVARFQRDPAPRAPENLAEQVLSEIARRTEGAREPALHRIPRPAFAGLLMACICALAGGAFVYMRVIRPEQSRVPHSAVAAPRIPAAQETSAPAATALVAQEDGDAGLAAATVAGRFHVSADSIEKLRSLYRIGYGGINHAFALAFHSGKSVDEILIMRTAHKDGWGLIARKLGLDPGRDYSVPEKPSVGTFQPALNAGGHAEAADMNKADRMADRVDKRAEQMMEKAEKRASRERGRN